MRLFARSEKGRSRAVNQDSFLFDEIDPRRRVYLVAVADGMGGHLAGEVASALAVSALSRHVKNACSHGTLGLSLYKTMADGFKSANQLIIDSSQGDGRRGMGTTLTAALLYNERMCVAHVGDSRAYLLTGGRLELLTQDHSVVGELIRKGDLSPEEAMKHPQRNVLTRALGSGPEIEVDIIERDFVSGDMLLLCTDGITNLVGPDEIERLLLCRNEGQTIVDELISIAQQRGGYDDATCVLCFVDSCHEGGATA